MSRGKYYEELEVGKIFRHRPGRTVGEADNTLFSALTMNPQALHLDEEFCRQTEFGRRVVNSLFTMATTVGLSVSDLTQGTTVANLGFQEVRFLKPVFHGDTIYAETEVISKRLSRSRPGQGIVEFEHRARNQRGELVMVARRTALMLCQSAKSAPPTTSPPETEATGGEEIGLSCGQHEHTVPLPGRVLLFCPGNRPAWFEKAMMAADMVILDLEDAVPPTRKLEAREEVLRALARFGPDRIIIRINAVNTPWHDDDIEGVRRAGARWVMLPKAEQPADIAKLAPFRVIALCESALGVLQAPAIAAVPNCVGIMWGGEDLARDLGGWSSRSSNGRYLPTVLTGRVMVLLAAAAAKRPDGTPVAIDAPFLSVHDTDGCYAETTEAAHMGFYAKAAVHPIQCEAIRKGFRPTPDQIRWAQGVVRLARERGGEPFTYEGWMIDEPLIARARRILAAAGGGEP